MTALLLLGPWTPMLFQGEEFGATSPFCYFADLGDDKLKEGVRKGRFEFLSQFPSAASPETQKILPLPHDVRTFENSKLDWSEREKNQGFVRLHRDLLKMRREDSRFSLQLRGRVDGAVLGRESFLLRFFGERDDDRLLIVNLGYRCELHQACEPLLAPPLDMEWEMIWSSDSPQYDGPGRVDIVPDDNWLLPAEAAVVFRARARTKPRRKPKKRWGIVPPENK